MFRDCCVSLNVRTEFESLDPSELEPVLTKFYVGARNRSGEFDKISTMNAVRLGMERHLKSTNNMEIIHDISFTKSNEGLKAQSIALKKTGHSIGVKHYLPKTRT